MPKKDPSYPRDRTSGTSAPETSCLSGSHGCKHPLVPPANFFGAAIYFQQPIHVSSSRGRTQLKQPTLERGKK